MPGMTLLGESLCFAPDAALMNCDSDDPNEPLDDAFDARARERSCPTWVDMNQRVVGDAEAWRDSESALLAADVSIGDYYSAMGQADFEPLLAPGVDADDEGEVALTARRPVLTLSPKDYTRGMQVAVDDERVAAGSCLRQACSRGVRYKR